METAANSRTKLIVAWVLILTLAGLMVRRSYVQFTNHRFVERLRADQVLTVSVGNTRFEDPARISTFVSALNSLKPFRASHTSLVGDVPLTIVLKDSQVKVFRVSRIAGTREYLVHSEDYGYEDSGAALGLAIKAMDVETPREF